MPFRDPQKRREYDRLYKRKLRAGLSNPPSNPGGVPPETRAATVDEVLALLREAADVIRSDADSRPTEKGKALAHVASVLLRAIESGDLVRRIEELERLLAQDGRLRLVR